MKFRGIKRLFRFPSRTRDDVRRDVREEFRFHLDMRADELVRLGLDEDEARAQARREFGDEPAGERACAMHGDRIERRRSLARLIEELRQDVRFGWRLIVRSPGFSAVTVLTLAIGIGANTTIFAVVNALLFTPLPVSAPHELARVKAGETQMAWLNYEDIRRANTVFSHLAAYRTTLLGLATDDRPLRSMGQRTSANFFTALGVTAAHGRTYSPTDSRRDVVVLADHVWRSRFGGSSSILGRTLVLGGRPYEVIGIMPPQFRGVMPPGMSLDFWIPADPTLRGSLYAERAESAFEVVGRLKPGVTHAQAASELAALMQQLRRTYPDIPESVVRVQVFPVDGIRAFEGMARTLLPVFGFLAVMTIVSGFVLLIGCANIAGLLIGRAAARRHEIAMRLTLGAGRGRLVRQLVTESLVLAALGGGAGLVIAGWLAGSFDRVMAGLPMGRSLDIGTDVNVAAYAVALTILTTIISGLAPARGASRFDVVSSLKDAHGGSTGRQRTRRWLVVGQVAVSVALLLWSGLFVRSLGRITSVDPGFDPSGVLLAGMVFERGAAEEAERIFVELQQRIRESPGVRSAGTASIVPLAMQSREEFYVAIADTSGQVSPRRVMASRLAPGWFETVRIPFIAGRDFTWDDRRGSPAVVIVNETLARQFWNESALGKRIFNNKQPVEVVGVVRDSKYWTLGETVAPTVYLPLRQTFHPELILHVRTIDERATMAAVLREMQRIAPSVAVEIEPMTEAVAVAVLPARIGAAATGAFGILAVLLAAMGVYGLVAFSVVQRTREIGVRKALGAHTVEIMRMVVGSTARMTMTGLAFGLGVGALGGLALRGFIFGVSPLDGVTFVSASAVVIAAALLASALPAMRATRIDPMAILRDS